MGKLLVAFAVLTHFTLILHLAWGVEAFVIIGIVVGFIVQIFYLLAFNRTKKLYYSYTPPDVDVERNANFNNE